MTSSNVSIPSTFADAFGFDDNSLKTISVPVTTNGNIEQISDPFSNHYDQITSTSGADIDPFGVSGNIKLSASSQKFDDVPFTTDNFATVSNDAKATENDDEESVRPRSGKEALLSTNWAAYQQPLPARSQEPIPVTLDKQTNAFTDFFLDSFQPQSQSQQQQLKPNANGIGPQQQQFLSSNLGFPIPHSKSINLMNPFSVPTSIASASTMNTNQVSPVDLLFDVDVDLSSLPVTSNDSTAIPNRVQSSYDLLGLTHPHLQQQSKVLKSDSLSNITNASPSATKTLTAASSLKNLLQPSQQQQLVSPTLLRLQTSSTSLASGSSSTPFDDKFLDWITESDDLMCSVDPKLLGSSKKIDINMMKSTEDLLGSIYKPIPTLTTGLPPQQQALPTLKESSLEITTPTAVPTILPVRRPSIENLPEILIHEPTNEMNDSNVVPDGYFAAKKESPRSSKIIPIKKPSMSDESEDDDEDLPKQMIFSIDDKSKQNLRAIPASPMPLLPPPPSPSQMKKTTTINVGHKNKNSKKAAISDDASSSSSASDDKEDDDDPLAMFRTKSLKNKKTDKPEETPTNLINDWFNDDDKPITEERKTSVSQTEKVSASRASPPPIYLYEENDGLPLEAYHNDINDLQLQQLNGWLLHIRTPLRQKDLYKSTFQRISETRTWQECYVRIFFDEKKLRFYLPQTIEQPFAEIELQSYYQLTKFNLQQYDQYTKIHTIKIFEANYREIPQVRIERLVTLPEKLIRKFTRPNKPQQFLLDHANCVQQEIVKFGQLNYSYLKKFSIILEDLFWTMPVPRNRIQKHIKEEVTVKVVDEYQANIDRYRHILSHKSRTRIFVLAFLNGYTPTVEIGINDWFRHGKEINKRSEIILNKTLQEYWIKPEQCELSTVIDKTEYENTHLLKFTPPDSQKIEIIRFRTRPRQNIELPLQVYCFMSVLQRQVSIRIELIVSSFFNRNLLSKVVDVATSSSKEDTDDHCPCQDIQIRFPVPDAWVYMFRVEKRFRYGAIHSVRRKAGKIKGLDRFMVHRGDSMPVLMATTSGTAKYEQAFRSIVWRIDQLPKKDQGAYKTHAFQCTLSIPTFDPIPEKYEPIAEVEYSMAQAFVSQCQIRSVAVPNAEEPPEKWVRSKTKFSYTVEIEYAFKDEEVKEFAPVEIEMKEQSMSQSENENNSGSDSN
ncbi:unnamed protein product [Didymodactylos carnosus]|uniref:Uncharacterized protein n=1 Tax=Didymodactylos carnosus TaxID=1234261 RepID=A0A813SLG2_9BILA|nr:unnamed protein product [Didymodactylos carnosus]CAF0796796.1 unnamed protein product [Didymodactylos carnosus]CAF3519824.1 unnamed protein product [Didymodactylos carnosus]CAF3581483.1 unnamed protein product [Didymodactylos carnosus]